MLVTIHMTTHGVTTQKTRFDKEKKIGAKICCAQQQCSVHMKQEVLACGLDLKSI
jgi:hypothetical protein